MIQQISTQKARELLGKTGEEMTDSEIEILKNQLYILVGQIIDNNIELCKKH